MIYVITGPTNTGKDSVAIELAKCLGGEIVNADAFHVYKQLKIGTNKPRDEDFLGIKHHLFEYVDVSEDYSIARYQSDARQIIEDLIARNIPIILLGGSGLYIKAALYDYRFKDETPVDLSEYEKLNNAELHTILRKVDAASADRIHPHNRRRVLRALQIYFSQGNKKSDIPVLKDEAPIYEAQFFGVEFDRADLYLRIEKRVHRMMEEGLEDEAKSLLARYGDKQQAFSAIGYKEMIEYIHGLISKEEAISQIIANTRHYAKRQITFVRHQFPMQWIKSAADIVANIKHG
ncbi:MAG: tRNA (adenosine(37)-N6)-dimethylallyltransferase MiaA [Bacilli bacterium]|jgi:tRNA dimethylallyltransferase